LPFQTLISNEGTGLKHESKAQPEQIRALAVTRVHHRIGALGISAMAALDGVIKVHLGL
jgi:mRNA interferase MazF